MVESFRDAQDGSEPPRETLIGIVELTVCGMIARRLCFSVVIANRSSNEIAITPSESGDVAVERQVFSVLVMPLVTDLVADVVEKRGGFEKDPRF